MARNRKHRKRVRKRFEKSVTIDQNLQAQLKEANADYGEYVQRKQSIESSSAAQRAKERNIENPAELTLYVGNFPYNTTAISLVDFLASLLTDSKADIDETKFPITLCKIPNPPVRGKGYFAFVTVSNANYKSMLLEFNNCVSLGCRKLHIKSSRRKHAMRSGHDVTALRCQVSKIYLGCPEYSHLNKRKQQLYEHIYGDVSKNGSWRVHWESSNASSVVMEVNGLEHVISFEFNVGDRLFRVECLMKYTQGQILIKESSTNSRQWVLSILLRTPPKIYRQTSQSDSAGTSTLYMRFPLLHEGIRNKYLWQLGGTSGQFNREWIRTVDFSDGAFGRCMLYRVCIDKGSARTARLFPYLKEFGLIHNSAPGNMRQRSVTMESSSLGRVKPGWSGTVYTDELFQNLNPEVKYYIQCLTSQNRLDFVSDAVEASEFASHAGKKVGLVLYALEELEKDWSIPFYFNPAKVLAKHLSYLTMGEGVVQDDEAINKDNGMFIRRVSITPLRVVCHAPELSPSNRVLRHFSLLRHRFIRVAFTDESLVSFFHAMSVDTLNRRMASVLRDGIFVAGRKYVFLAYSNSQLREQSCWMYDEEADISDGSPPSVDALRGQLGNFDRKLLNFKLLSLCKLLYAPFSLLSHLFSLHNRSY